MHGNPDSRICVPQNNQFNADGSLNTARLTPRNAGFGATRRAEHAELPGDDSLPVLVDPPAFQYHPGGQGENIPPLLPVGLPLIDPVLARFQETNDALHSPEGQPELRADATGLLEVELDTVFLGQFIDGGRLW